MNSGKLLGTRAGRLTPFRYNEGGRPESIGHDRPTTKKSAKSSYDASRLCRWARLCRLRSRETDKVPRVAWLLVVLLLVLHQDWWLWENDELLWGFLPVGLGWHVGISLLAAAFWALACFVWWPRELDQIASGVNGAANEPPGVGVQPDGARR